MLVQGREEEMTMAPPGREWDWWDLALLRALLVLLIASSLYLLW